LLPQLLDDWIESLWLSVIMRATEECHAPSIVDDRYLNACRPYPTDSRDNAKHCAYGGKNELRILEGDRHGCFVFRLALGASGLLVASAAILANLAALSRAIFSRSAS
jgi:hypothetical protein